MANMLDKNNPPKRPSPEPIREYQTPSRWYWNARLKEEAERLLKDKE